MNEDYKDATQRIWESNLHQSRTLYALRPLFYEGDPTLDCKYTQLMPLSC